MATRALADANHEIETALGHLQRTHIELVQAEKLAALGALVAGVAHELNTPIGNSLMVASTLQDLGKSFRKGMSNNLKRSTLESFVSETESAADILVRNLMVAGELITSFKQVAVDQTSSQRRRFSLSDVVHEIVVMMQPTFRKTPYVIEEDIPKDIWLDSYPGPFGQVVTNLLSNTLLEITQWINWITSVSVIICNNTVYIKCINTVSGDKSGVICYVIYSYIFTFQ